MNFVETIVFLPASLLDINSLINIFLSSEYWYTFLQTVPRSWSETGLLKGAVDYNADKDFVGPLTIGLALTRKSKEKERQRELDARMPILHFL